MQSVLDQTFKVEQLLVDSNFSSPDTLKDVQDILGQYSISATLFMCRGAPSVLPSLCVVVLHQCYPHSVLWCSISAALFMCRGAPSVLPSQCVVVLHQCCPLHVSWSSISATLTVCRGPPSVLPSLRVVVLHQCCPHCVSWSSILSLYWLCNITVCFLHVQILLHCRSRCAAWWQPWREEMTNPKCVVYV